MKSVKLGRFDASVIGLGCMRIAGKAPDEVDTLIRTALDSGITLFDHADIYGGGDSEQLFGTFLRSNPGLRDRMILQSKCGICKGCYDFSRDHIVESVEGSLRRLQTDSLDTLLFHRPDVLAEPEEFAEAVRTLKQQGKVRQFGVSNMNPAQIRLLESWTGEKLVADQMQLSLMHAGMVTCELNVNVDNSEGTMQDGSLLSFCRQNGVTLQAWSPFQYGMFRGFFVGNEKFPELNAQLEELAQVYGTTPSVIALAWILRIPGQIQPIIGTTNPRRVQELCAAAGITLTRQEWYSLYLACGYLLP